MSILIEKEGWEEIEEDDKRYIIAYGQKFPYCHPLSIHLKLYKENTNPVQKLFHLKSAHDYLWPDTIWHYWTEERFRAHCEGRNYIVLAGGASTGKSFSAAQLALLFWLASPQTRAVIVASTTLESLNSRIWGYVISLLKTAKIRLPVIYTKSPNQKILYDDGQKKQGNLRDTIHGMFAIAAKKGDDDEAISSWIGRHPKEGLMLVLDEATDMPLSIMKALPNLEAKSDIFQCIAIGNSLSRFDLHGTLATPKAGWDSIDPMKDKQWETTQRNGICLFSSCYDSPAIHETDPERKKKLSKFLVTQEEIEAKKKEFGEDSDSFFRFVLGFWRKTSSVEVVIDPDYIDRFRVREGVYWSGLYPLTLIGGLDPSFSSGGDDCILRLAYLGVASNGKVVLDYQGDRFLYRIPIIASSPKAPELQIIDSVIDIMRAEGLDIRYLAIDSSGAGRMLGETLKLRLGTNYTPVKILTGYYGGKVKQHDHEWVTKDAYNLWTDFRPFIEREQIKGLDSTSIFQLTHRLTFVNVKTGKMTLELKHEYKRRIGAIIRNQAKSPDEADAAALTLQAAILRAGFVPGATMNINVDLDWMQQKLAALKPQESEKKVEKPELKATFTGDIHDLNFRRFFW
jgi:hypothetical protein